MKILITGATGFIGQYLVPLLEGHQLLLLGLEEARFSQSGCVYLKADLGDEASWKKQVRDFAPDACIHLAWKGLPDYSFHCCLENFLISVRLFGFLQSLRCRKILVAGTCWEYGNAQGRVKEEDQALASSLFASFKTSLRIVGESLFAQGPADFIWARLFFVYGPGQRESSLIPSCYTAMAAGRQPVLKNPNVACDFIHVADVAAAFKALIEADNARGIFNIGSGIATEVSRVCSYVSAALNVNSPGLVSNSLAEKSGFWADISRIRIKTGWKPQISLQKGVEDTVQTLRKKHD